MKPNRIFLVRHGESEGNVDPTIFQTMQDYEVPLTLKGVMQARLAGKKLHDRVSRSVAFHVSPFSRTTDTYFEIAKSWKSPLPVSFNPQLREREWSGWEYSGKRLSDKQWRSFWFRFPNGGDAPSDVYDRFSIFMMELNETNQKSDVVIVSHGTAINVMMTKLLNLHPTHDFARMRNSKNCEITELARLSGSNKYKLVGDLEDKFKFEKPMNLPVS